MRIAQLVILAAPGARARRGRRAAGERARRARLRLVARTDGAAHPRLGDPPLARARAALPPGEAGQGVLAAAGRRRRRGRDADRGAAPRAARGARRSRPTCSSKGRSRSSTRSRRSVGAAPRKHVVHIIFAADLSHRSLDDVETKDAAVKGARLFSNDELRGRRRAPADQAVPRALAAGRPGRLPRRALGALEPAAARARTRAAETACASSSSSSGSGASSVGLAARACASASASSGRRTTGCAAAAARAGTCRRRGRWRQPSAPDVAVVAEAADDAAERLGARVEDRAPGVVLEAGQRLARPRRSRAARRRSSAARPRPCASGSRPIPGSSLAGDVAVEAAEQLVAAADGEEGGAALDSLAQRVRPSSTRSWRDERLLAILAAADVEEVDLAAGTGSPMPIARTSSSWPRSARALGEHGDVAAVGVDVQVVGIEVADADLHAARSQ